jgi:hypothetical protein
MWKTTWMGLLVLLSGCPGGPGGPGTGGTVGVTPNPNGETINLSVRTLAVRSTEPTQCATTPVTLTVGWTGKLLTPTGTAGATSFNIPQQKYDLPGTVDCSVTASKGVSSLKTGRWEITGAIAESGWARTCQVDIRPGVVSALLLDQNLDKCP